MSSFSVLPHGKPPDHDTIPTHGDRAVSPPLDHSSRRSTVTSSTEGFPSTRRCANWSRSYLQCRHPCGDNRGRLASCGADAWRGPRSPASEGLFRLPCLSRRIGISAGLLAVSAFQFQAAHAGCRMAETSNHRILTPTLRTVATDHGGSSSVALSLAVRARPQRPISVERRSGVSAGLGHSPDMSMNRTLTPSP